MTSRHLMAGLIGFGTFAIGTAAEAHVGGGAGTGLAQGLAHPLGGIDHLLAMVAVGLWAAQVGGRAMWLVPLSFVAMMVAGALAGMNGLPLPLVESGILVSLFVLGLFVAFGLRLPTAAVMTIVGLFAVLHGHAHGTEMPQTVPAALYGLGFVLATGLLHLSGVVAGVLCRRGPGPRLVRAGGGAIAATGVILFLGL